MMLQWLERFNFHAYRRKIQLNHLCFADDLMLFLKGDMAFLREIRLLQHFRSISGLEIINPPETEVYTSGYTAE